MRTTFWVIALLSCLVFASCGARRTAVLRSPGGTLQQGQQIPSSGSRGTSVSGHTYIERYRNIAVAEMNQYGIPASIKLAQALLESGNGNSYLAREANNHFGIKCGGVWSGPSVTRPDDAVNDCFRVYRDPEESFKDHSQFLLRKRYERLFSLAKDDYKGWAHGLKAAGYATNPRYADLLIDLIERYNLHQYDRHETYVQQVVREEKVEQIIEQRDEHPAEPEPESVKPPIAMTIYEVKYSDTLYGIGQQFGLTTDELMELNGLDSETIYVGQLLVVSK